MKEIKTYTVPGFKFGAVEAKVKKPGRLDLSLIYSEVPATPAAVFTKNKVKAAPVLLDIEVAKGRSVRAIVANSGNANACNGIQGMKDALRTAHLTGEAMGVNTSDVFVASTGVIGASLPMGRIAAGIKLLPGSLKEDGILDAAAGIMTTDTFPKIYGVSERIGGKEIHIVGIAKGSGMINPNMATMLSFIVTDAAVQKQALQAALKDGVENSFNCVTVDGDTSTNDTAIILANGMAGNVNITVNSAEYGQFKKTLASVLLALAKMVARDGEGATKLVEVIVEGAASPAEAKKAAKSISNSPLVKTALFAEDANWGRIA
ncbi:MAG: bifunctional glutamate N-acetyltransferase/amino-acid acetyltransferase ArgJ, partial [Nitrospirota bacterium]